MSSRCSWPLETKVASMPKSPCKVLQVTGILLPATRATGWVPSIQLSNAVELGRRLYQARLRLKALRFLRLL